MALPAPNQTAWPVVSAALWLAVLFGVSVTVRGLLSADHNIAEDPFILIEAAKHLLETGTFRAPEMGGPDLVLHWVAPSWPVGFPLLLAGMFGVFGPTEAVARAVTIVVSSLVPLMTVLLTARLFGRRAAVASGIIAAFHPLAVAFAGQIFTNNLSLTLFTSSLALLAAVTVRGDGFAPFVEISEDRVRTAALAASAFLFGSMLAVRDTDGMFVGPFLYLLYQSGAFARESVVRHWRVLAGPVALAAFALLLGWSPSLYFNVQNFGSPVVSAHAATGIGLDINYLLFGTGTRLGVPGFVVMAAAIAMCQLPALLALPAVVSGRPLVRGAAVMTGLVAVPMLLVNGSFSVGSSGAAPRYVLLLTPFACMFAGGAFVWAWESRRRVAGIIAVGLVAWQALMFYPPPALFELWPRLAYLAYYSPAYIARPYRNYPDHANPMVQWVIANTPADSVIVAQSRVQHFYYYAHRDVNGSPGAVDQWARYVSSRPVFLVEDRVLAALPESMKAIRVRLAERGMRLVLAGSVKVFTPEAGDIDVHAYRVTPDGSPASP